jgi:hypothetical protein
LQFRCLNQVYSLETLKASFSVLKAQASLKVFGETCQLTAIENEFIRTILKDNHCIKNLLKLHEAIAIVLLDKEHRSGSFDEIATFIKSRNLFPEREVNITLSKQIRLRSTQGHKRYAHLIEQNGKDSIRLKKLFEINSLYPDIIDSNLDGKNKNPS